MEATGEKNGNKIASALTSGIYSTKTGYDPAFETVMDKVMELVEKGEVSKNNFDVYLRIIWYEGYLITDRKDYEKAVRVARLSIEKFPGIEGIEDSYHELAVALMALGRWEEAIEAWKEYVDRAWGESRDNGYLCLAYSLIKLGRENDACREYIIMRTRTKFGRDKAFSDKLVIEFKKLPIIKGETEYDFWERAYPILERYAFSDKIVEDNKGKEKIIREIIDSVSDYIKKYNIGLK